jgi:hypothetical protein
LNQSIVFWGIKIGDMDIWWLLQEKEEEIKKRENMYAEKQAKYVDCKFVRHIAHCGE